MSNRYPRGGPSRASASTVCQKCLQRGHYSYECKASAAERPYVARPSRTQQLLNPKYAPKLSEIAPPEDLTRKAGIADEILAKKDEERGRKRQRLDADGRSVSRSLSASSISTISTNRSRSASPPASPPQSREPEHRRHHRSHRRGRHSSTSPPPSGSGADRSSRHHDDNHHRRKPRVNLRSPSPRRSRSPRRKRSRSRSGSLSRSRASERHAGTIPGYRDRGPPRTRERSLSPYSRRLALTQTMNR